MRAISTLRSANGHRGGTVVLCGREHGQVAQHQGLVERALAEPAPHDLERGLGLGPRAAEVAAAVVVGGVVVEHLRVRDRFGAPRLGGVAQRLLVVALRPLEVRRDVVDQGQGPGTTGQQIRRLPQAAERRVDLRQHGQGRRQILVAVRLGLHDVEPAVHGEPIGPGRRREQGGGFEGLAGLGDLAAFALELAAVHQRPGGQRVVPKLSRGLEHLRHRGARALVAPQDRARAAELGLQRLDLGRALGGRQRGRALELGVVLAARRRRDPLEQRELLGDEAGCGARGSRTPPRGPRLRRVGHAGTPSVDRARRDLLRAAPRRHTSGSASPSRPRRSARPRWPPGRAAPTYRPPT